MASQPAYTDISGTPAIPAASSSTPLVDSGTGAVGTGTTFARADHVHPQNTKITGLLVFVNNAAAIAGGLAVGNLYRSGADPDAVFVVH